MGKPQILRINDVLVPDFAALATSSSRRSESLAPALLLLAGSEPRLCRGRRARALLFGEEVGAAGALSGLRATQGVRARAGSQPRVPGRPVHIVLRTSGVSLNPDRRVHTPPWLGSLATSLLLECAGSLPHNTQSCHGAGDSGGRGVARRREVAGQRPAETRRLLRGVSLSHTASSQALHDNKLKARRLEDELAVTRPLRAGHTSPSTDALVSRSWREEPVGWSQSPRVRQAGPGEVGHWGRDWELW